MCLPKVQEAIQQGEDEDGVYEAVQRLMDLNQTIVIRSSIQEFTNHKIKSLL